MTLSPGRPGCLASVGAETPSALPRFTCRRLSELPVLQPEDPRVHHMVPASSFPALAGQPLLLRWQAKCLSRGQEPLTRDDARQKVPPMEQEDLPARPAPFALTPFPPSDPLTINVLPFEKLCSGRRP